MLQKYVLQRFNVKICVLIRLIHLCKSCPDSEVLIHFWYDPGKLSEHDVPYM